jgi:hypothetical protein
VESLESKSLERVSDLDHRGAGEQDDLLCYADQALFLSLRATGQESVAQFTWIYEHPVDFDRLKRFHQNLGYGLLGRRIERSSLPFGRHRWVASLGPSAPLDISSTPRPRSEFTDWLDERAQVSADPEFGPGWHLSAAMFDDGSTAITIVASHCLVDGMGLLETLINAINDTPRDLGLSAPHARTRRQALRADIRETIRSVPDTAKALGVGARLGVRRWRESRRDKVSRDGGVSRDATAAPTRPVTSDLASGASASREVIAPAVIAVVDCQAWDSRAEALGGNSHSLFAGFAAKLAQHVGRTRASDGAVTLMIPVNEREPGDTRANAVTIGYASLDPASVTTDLTEARAQIRQVLTSVREVPDETLRTLPLIPFVPKRAVVGTASLAMGLGADLPVSASNLGDVDAAVLRADGTDAEGFIIRGVDGRVTQELLERRHGYLTVLCNRSAGKVFLSVIGYRPGGENTKAALRALVVETLAEFGLSGTVE